MSNFGVFPNTVLLNGGFFASKWTKSVAFIENVPLRVQVKYPDCETDQRCYEWVVISVPRNIMNNVEISLRANDQALLMSHLKACNKLADISIPNEDKNSPCFCEAHQGFCSYQAPVEQTINLRFQSLTLGVHLLS
jgi:hypothetical protein